ncbi:MAG TPA: molybdopterin-dependent oxidoreductase [Pyrinomonadaceae bacterium]|nr:molybdopterin-dependent oxidoreductase [Pyrinomonadaceae bacterium]
MSTELVKVTINGADFQVAKGARLIDVCRENDFAIPSFCYYADLALQASCRMCLVRIEKMPKLQTSCTITCTDGMIVTTQSEEIEKAQRSMLEFLLANHPLDCPVCDRGGECELQELTFDWGNLEERFIERKNAKLERYLSPMVANDPQRCILCKRCTRVCDEWMGEEAIEAGNRGANTVIGTFGGWLNCSQCGNCIEVCPTGTLLDGTYRHQHRPWELTQTISTCTYCSDGCQMSLGSRGDELARIVARDRYVNGHNGEFLCVKGRFGHPFVNHEERIRTPLIRYQKGGRLVPATWDEAIRFIAQNIDKTVSEHGNNAVGVLASPRLTNESVYALKKLATEVIGTENFAVSDRFSLKAFFDNLGGPLATHKDIRHAKTIVLIGGEPEELQPFTGKQIRQAVRNGGAKLVIINSVPIRLREQAAQFIHINPGSEDAAVLALAGSANDSTAARKMGIDAAELASLREAINQTSGDVVIMFGGELSAASQAIVAQLPFSLGDEGRRVLLHPLPLFNNSVGAHDMSRDKAKDIDNVLDDEAVRAMIVAGDPMLPKVSGSPDNPQPNRDFLVLWELFISEVSEFARQADVILPAASFAEVDGTFTNNDGLVQRVRKSIDPVHQSLPDWIIAARLANELGVDFGFERSATAVFREISERVAGYDGIRYPHLKDESHPVQVKHAIAPQRDLSSEVETLRRSVETMSETRAKITETPSVGHELFKPGTLISKTPQIGLLDAGNPKPESVFVSPLYQITIGEKVKREPAVA